jgi:iron complex transport system permease protein
MTEGRAGSRRVLVVGVATGAVLLTIVVVSVFMGQAGLPAGDIIRAFWSHDNELARTILWDFRLPRIALAVIIGSELAVSGAILQGVTRNALASPDIIGITAGASLVAVFLILAVPNVPISAVPVAALIGGGATGVLVYLLAWKKGVSPERLALTGVAVTAVFQAGVTAIVTLFVENNDVQLALQWLSGSLYGKQWNAVFLVLPWAAVGMTAAVVLSHKVDVLLLGEEAATALGMRVQVARVALVGVAVALAASAVSAVGTIAFVGLIVPHTVRMLIGSRHRLVVPFAAMGGASLLLIADDIGRSAFATREFPAGLLTALLGAPYFIYLIMRRKTRISV